MPLSQRIFNGSATDWAHMKAVIDAQPSEHLHVVDLPYRFCSWAFDAPTNCALWEDPNGVWWRGQFSNRRFGALTMLYTRWPRPNSFTSSSRG